MTRGARPARLFGPDRAEIHTLDDWLAYGPTPGGAAQARAWLRDGAPAMPAEVTEALARAGLPAFDDVNARPEHPTGTHRHDLLACCRAGGATQAVVCVRTTAGEPLDPGDLRAAADAARAEADARGVADAVLLVHRVGAAEGAVLPEGLAAELEARGVRVLEAATADGA